MKSVRLRGGGTCFYTEGAWLENGGVEFSSGMYSIMSDGESFSASHIFPILVRGAVLLFRNVCIWFLVRPVISDSSFLEMLFSAIY